jgi:putative membrane protein
VRWIKFILLVLVVVALALFILSNNDRVVLRYSLFGLYGWEMPPVPLSLVILGSMILGVAIGGLLDVVKRMQLKMTVRQQQRTIEKLEKEVETLRPSVSGASPAPIVNEDRANREPPAS